MGGRHSYCSVIIDHRLRRVRYCMYCTCCREALECPKTLVTIQRSQPSLLKLDSDYKGGTNGVSLTGGDFFPGGRVTDFTSISNLGERKISNDANLGGTHFQWSHKIMTRKAFRSQKTIFNFLMSE